MSANIEKSVGPATLPELQETAEGKPGLEFNAGFPRDCYRTNGGTLVGAESTEIRGD